MNRIFLILYFYRSLALFSGSISLACWLATGMPSEVHFQKFLPPYLMVKIFTSVIIFAYHKKGHRHVFPFYANMGLSKRALYTAAFVMDLAAFFCFVFLISLFR